MKIFKECPMCATVWKDRKQFITDNNLVINGYQVNFTELEMGLFYFTHEVEGCYSTMALEVNKFTDLGPENRFKEKKILTEECPTHCLFQDNLETCPAECECAYVRELIGELKRLKTKTQQI